MEETKQETKSRKHTGTVTKTRVEIPVVEPWAMSVVSEDLLTDLRQTISRYVVVTQPEKTALALWVMFTYVHDAFRISPLLAIISPEKRCGKSTLLTTLHQLVARPLAASSVTPAIIYRSVQAFHPTLIIDEMDTYLDQRHELVGLLNSGQMRELAKVARSRPDTFEPEFFSTWCPKAIAKIGSLPTTIEDRSIVISLRRKLPTEKVEKYRASHDDKMLQLRQQLVRWGNDNFDALSEAEPVIPSELHDRAADNWYPLLAIAENAGERWAQSARDAAVTLNANREDTEDGLTRLLMDIMMTFHRERRVRMSSTDLVARLCSLKDSPWGDWAGAKRLTPHKLAARLRPYGIRPKSLWEGGTDGHSVKGYEVTDFMDAVRRYLPTSNSENGEVKSSRSRGNDA